MSLADCQQELLLCIASFLKPKDIASLCLVSRQFNILQEIIYHDIEVQHENVGRLHQTCKTNPTLFGATNRFRVTMASGRSPLNVIKRICDIMPLITRANHIELIGGERRTPLKEFYGLSVALESDPGFLAQVQTLVINGTLLALLSCEIPQLHTLDIREMSLEVLDSVKTTALHRVHRQRLSKLCIDITQHFADDRWNTQCDRRVRNFIDALNCFGVKELTLSICNDRGEVHGQIGDTPLLDMNCILSLRNLLQQLQPIAHSLKSLKITKIPVEVLLESVHDALLMFTFLSRLEVPLSCFRGQDRLDGIGYGLPSSLEGIILYGDETKELQIITERCHEHNISTTMNRQNQLLVTNVGDEGKVLWEAIRIACNAFE
ncbi:unnamed protein product [Periconia digitata]|uniref:F-box domain-containing protein n=1 Tax=Periconia digitata TaxID=1303443 RepID=A0A9W4XUH0_9PLEO|nr:unnamed protein product [Periconia digitata]